MQRKLCLGLGVVLLGVAAMLYFGGNADRTPGLRSVGETEAAMVIGGGSSGATYETVSCSGTYGCNASGLNGNGPGDQRRTGSKSCGGSCAPALATGLEPAPE